MQSANRSSGIFTRRRRGFLFRKLVRTLGRSTGTAHQIAMGVAIGFFIGWLPIVGIQMVVAVVVCAIFRANKVVPLFPIWLTNPVTIIPIYSFNYWIGWLIVGGPPLSELVKVLSRVLSVPHATHDMGRFAAWWMGVKHALGEILSMGWEMQLPLWLGCVLVGTALAVPGYYISRRMVLTFRVAMARKRHDRVERRHFRTTLDAKGGGVYSEREPEGRPANAETESQRLRKIGP